MFTRTVKILAATLALGAAISLGTGEGLAGGGKGHGGGGGGHHGGGGGGHGGAHFSGGSHIAGGRGGFSGAHVRGFSGSAHIRSFRGAHISGAYRHGFTHGRGFTSGHIRSVHGRSFTRIGASRRGYAHVGRGYAGVNRAHAQHGLHAAAWGGGKGWKHHWNHWGNPYWRTGWNGGWGGWIGPVFWPYVYGDFLAFVFWPYGYDYPFWFDPFWAYGDVFLWDAVFWPGPYYGPYYAYAPDYSDVYGDYAYADPARRRAAREASREIAAPTSNGPALAQICSGLGPGITDLPVDRIETPLHLKDDQLKALDALRTASSQASDILKASCLSEISLTPVGRLDAMQKRVDGMIQALGIVRTPLDNFYNSLNDEQRHRFAELGPSAKRHRRAATSANGMAALCSRRTESFTQLPVQRIEQAIKPTQEQRDALDKLKVASAQAANQLQASCPTDMPKGPIDRFDAVSKRLDAMSAAIKTVRPALDNFYASLMDEQKARFNVLGPPAASGPD